MKCRCGEESIKFVNFVTFNQYEMEKEDIDIFNRIHKEEEGHKDLPTCKWRQQFTWYCNNCGMIHGSLKNTNEAHLNWNNKFARMINKKQEEWLSKQKRPRYAKKAKQFNYHKICNKEIATK